MVATIDRPWQRATRHLNPLQLPGAPFQFTETHSLTGADGDILTAGGGAFQIDPVAAPGTMGLLGLGKIGARVISRRAVATA
jgi:hypothetical protein